MAFLQNFRTKMHNYFLDKRIKEFKAERRNISFAEAKSVGILFDITNPQNEKVVQDYMEYLKKQGKSVELLAYVNDNARHNNYVFRHFNNRDLSMFFFPKSDVVEKFMNTKFDLLICMYTGEIAPLEYVATFSNAYLRVGQYHEQKTHCYDLMIDTPASADLKTYSGQLDYFLKLINKKNEQLV